MGCDIHCHFEIKINNKWHHYASPGVERDYTLFNKMAGVRSYVGAVEPISEPKGLPVNPSIVTRLDAEYWGEDAHSHSWFDADEIENLMEFYEGLYSNEDERFWELHGAWGYLFGNGWESFKKHRGDYPKEVQDIRLIFWFDS